MMQRLRQWVIQHWPQGGMGGTRPSVRPSVRDLNYSTNPLLASKTPPWRSQLVVALVGLSFLGMVFKAVYVQAINPEFFQAKSEKQHAMTERVQAGRGRILDRNGRLLAISVYAPTIYLAPQQFRNKPPSEEKLRQLQELLGLKPAEFEAKINGRRSGGYVPLRREAPTELVRQVRALRIEGVGVEPRYVRSYPEGEAAAHLIGWVDSGDKGVDGLEWAFNDVLEGTAGVRVVVRDRLGQIIDELEQISDPHPGDDLQLAIDSQLQSLAYQHLRDAVTTHKAKSGSVVVLDVRSGEILAMTNYPSYAPANRRQLNDLTGRNRALTDANEPGSTMKPFVVAEAIENGLVQPETVIDTTAFRISDRLVSDHDHSFRALTVAQIVQQSSNPGTARLALRLSDRTLHETFSNLGFGHKPDMGLPDTLVGRRTLGSATGRLRPWQKWQDVEKASMSYGYGISVSLIQLARAYTALANDGAAQPLSLVKGFRGGEPVRVYRPDTARTMRTMLRGTISEGTGFRAQPAGYSAAGKTGTAQKLEGRGYSNSRHCAWFVGFSPAEKPRVVVAVLVDEPQGPAYYGGQVAAPVFKAVVENALRMMAVPPDLEVPLPSSASGVAAASSSAAGKANSNRKARPTSPKVEP